MNEEQLKAKVCELFEFGEKRWAYDGNEFRKLAAFIAAHEREECAKLCDRFGDREMSPYECAAAIRKVK